MNSTPPPSPEPQDHGRVIKTARLRLSWAWLFPALALAAATWLFWSQWREEGPEIRIHFQEAPGVQPGKTLLIYRGVTAGKVTAVHLDASLQEVVVSIRLRAFAKGLARQNTAFWIDQPVISLQETTGLESIIQGNSIRARLGDGPPAKEFRGLSQTPVLPFESPVLNVRLRAEEIPSLSRGAPVFCRGALVGKVRKAEVDENGAPYLELAVEDAHAHLVRTTSRFWPLPASSLHVGPGGVTLDFTGLESIIQGGIAFDHFGPAGEPAASGAEFRLSPNERSARAVEGPIEIAFANGHGLLPNETLLCYLGQPVGIVRHVRVDAEAGHVSAEVWLHPGYNKLQREDSTFTIIRSNISLRGVSGLETLLTGAYIEVEPGVSEQLARNFIGKTTGDDSWQKTARTGFALTLHAPEIPNLGPGAPVLYRGLTVGVVLEKSQDAEGQPMLTAAIEPAYQKLIARNTRFWREPATRIEAGPGVLKAALPGLETLWQGGISFDVFGDPGAAAESGSRFTLFPDKTAARATSPPIRISFPSGRGILAGQTQVRYLGQPIGLVENVTIRNTRVEVDVRFDAEYELLRRADTRFSLIQPRISTRGVTGLETLVSGVFIECVPGSSRTLASTFTGFAPEEPEDAPETGLEIRLTAPSTLIAHGAPVVYRDMRIGSVVGKSLSPTSGEVILTVAIEKPYVPLIRENTKFWDASGVKASLGFISLRIKSDTLISPNGKVALATPEGSAMGTPAQPGQVFPLHPNPHRQWLRWSPDIPLKE